MRKLITCIFFAIITCVITLGVCYRDRLSNELKSDQSIGSVKTKGSVASEKTKENQKTIIRAIESGDGKFAKRYWWDLRDEKFWEIRVNLPEENHSYRVLWFPDSKDFKVEFGIGRFNPENAMNSFGTFIEMWDREADGSISSYLSSRSNEHGYIFPCEKHDLVCWQSQFEKSIDEILSLTTL